MQINLDKSLVASEDESNRHASIVGTQWLVGALITLVPIIIIIYFIFFWAPNGETESNSEEMPIVAVESTAIETAKPATPVIPTFDDTPIVKEVPQEKIDAYKERQEAVCRQCSLI